MGARACTRWLVFAHANFLFLVGTVVGGELFFSFSLQFKVKVARSPFLLLVQFCFPRNRYHVTTVLQYRALSRE
jgi:hypothetical protein